MGLFNSVEDARREVPPYRDMRQLRRRQLSRNASPRILNVNRALPWRLLIELPPADGSHHNPPATRTPDLRGPHPVDDVTTQLRRVQNTSFAAFRAGFLTATMSPPVSSLPETPGPLWRLGSTAIMGFTGVLCKAFLYGLNRVETQGLDNFLRILDERKAGRKRGLVTASNHISV